MKKGAEIYQQNGKRIVKGTGYYPTQKVEDIRQLVKNSAKEYGSKTGFKYKNENGEIIEKSYTQFDQDIDCLGTALMAKGLKGCRISVIGENRYEWGVCYFAVINGIGIGVPLDKYLPRNEVVNLVERGHVEAIFYSAAYHEMMLGLAKTNSVLKCYICMDEIELDGQDGRFTTMAKLIGEGRRLLDKGDRSFTDAELDRNKMSILLFTSGTTNISKGVMLSHDNVASNVTAISGIIKLLPTDVHLSLLPLHHTFENTIGLMYMVSKGVCISYCQGIKHISDNIQEFGVSILVAVPAIFDAIYSKLQDGIEKSGKKKLLDTLIKVSRFLMKIGIDVRRLLFKSVLEKLGPKLRLFVSGAAPMSGEIIKGYEDLGIKFIQGYGLTETSPVISATSEFLNIPGTIGYPVVDVEVTIDSPDENGMGEIMTRGTNVMLGYFESPEETKEVIDSEGWFKTGDLGFINERGILTITGRVKSMIVFTNGKKAFPEEYEMLLSSIPGVRDSYAWGHKAGDGAIEVCAKLVIDKEHFQDNPGFDIGKIGDILESEIRKINKTLPQYKIVRYFVMSYQDLIKTTTLKIKRPQEHEKMQRYLESKGMDMRKANKELID